MNDTTLTAAERIDTFADAVRAELADLPADEVDDLVEGLVGDLTDQAADHGGEIQLGDPVAYAEELRSAAGLPERDPRTTSKTPWHERMAASAGRFVGRIRSSAFGAWLLDLLLALRPVWWVLRGLVLTVLIAIPTGLGPRTVVGYGGFPAQVFTWTLFGAIILVSVQWGRGRWLPGNALRHVRTVASVVAVLFLPLFFSPVLFSAYNAVAYPPDSGYTPPSGLLLDGTQVGNIFVYDKDGTLIDGAQLYTNRGTPVNLFGEESANIDSGATRLDSGEGEKVVVPFRDGQGRPVWNVFPLPVGRFDPSTLQVDSTDTVAPHPPFLRAPDRALTATPGPTPGSTALPTPGPSSTAAPTPVPSPTSTPAG